MKLRPPFYTNHGGAERYCDECRTDQFVRATHVIDLRYNPVCLCDDHFTELAIALSLAVTEEHPE